MYKSFVKFIPKYFIVFDATVNGTILFISFSDYSLQGYRKRIDFCISFSHPVTLLNSYVKNNKPKVVSFAPHESKQILNYSFNPFQKCDL